MDELGKALELFYGRDYCMRMTTDLEKLRDDQFQGNWFLFKKGWLQHTVDLLSRLQQLGFPIRTKDHILIHLSPPVEKMALGELYLQVGRRVPGSLSLKFTRRQADNKMVIQPTVLEADEERRLAADPCLYLEELRATARPLLSTSDAQHLLTTLIIVNSKYERQRVQVNSFFHRIYEQANSLGHQFHVPHRRLPDYPLDGQHFYQARNVTAMSIPCTAPVTNETRPQRSGSEGNIVNTVNPVENGQRSKGMYQRNVEPEENDENNEGSVVGYISEPQWPLSTVEYAGTVQGVVGLSPRRSSNDSTGRTSLQDEYTGVTMALSTLGLSSREPNKNFRDEIVGVRRDSNSLSVGVVSEDYASTRSAFGYLDNTWNSHQDSDSHTGYPPMYVSTSSHQTLLPIPVEELNNAAMIPK